MKIAFIGVGVMGQGMVRNLMKKGHELHIFSRTMHKAQEVISEGAIWHDSVAECVSGCPVIITIVGYPKDVEEVYFAANGILAAARKGSIVIDMTTTSPCWQGAFMRRPKIGISARWTPPFPAATAAHGWVRLP